MKQETHIASYWISQRWGSLTLAPMQQFPMEWSSKSHKEFLFICDCGRERTAVMKDITDCQKASCGKCRHQPISYWISQRWGALHLEKQEFPELEWSSGSNVKLQFSCNCGKKIYIPTNSVTRGDYTSCGHCDDMSKEYWLSQKWGKLKLDPNQELPDEWGKMSQRHFIFNCDCGKSPKIRMHRVTVGANTTCGKCNFMPKKYWLTHKFSGKLSLDLEQELPDEWSLSRPLLYVCKCGRRIKTSMQKLPQSCGHCNDKSKEYWLTQKWGKLRLDSNQKLPDEWGVGYGIKLRYLCDCGKTKRISTGHITWGTLSCGCIQQGHSSLSPAYEIYEFIQLMVPDVEFSYWFKTDENKRREYDIYIPSKHLAIEYHGLIWHSEKYLTGARDHEKFLLARARGDRLIQIYSDEWRDKQEVMKAQLQEILAPQKKTRIKPIFTLHTKTPPEARTFLDQHHYLGVASGCLTVIAHHGEAIVGVWIFMKREEGVILWHRACWHHAYKAWNPHEKVLHLALPELKKMGFNKMITFSDNRFHTGELYTKLGFTFEKEIPPEYYYTDSLVRKSKYTFRVKAGINEKAEAKAKGWYRIWDSGKRRFSLPI
jgi:hypothetical protein